MIRDVSSRIRTPDVMNSASSGICVKDRKLDRDSRPVACNPPATGMQRRRFSKNPSDSVGKCSSSSACNGPPTFRCGTSVSGLHLILLRGPAVLVLDDNLTQGSLELHVPASFEQFSTQLAVLHFARFTDDTELLHVVPLGVREEHISPFIRASFLHVADSRFGFRSLQETELWHVAIRDVLSASRDRYMELVSYSPEPPRGFRRHYSVLCEELSTNISPVSRNLASDALRALEYLSETTSCPRAVSLEMQDFVWETRERLKKV